MLFASRKVAGASLAAIVLLAMGCSVNPALRIADAMPRSDGLLLDDVPFHAQTEYQCGPAALATVLGASDLSVTPEVLAPQVFLPGRQGSLQVELLASARRAGRIPYVVEPSIEGLMDELRAGRPVLVLQNLWVRTLPKWHFAVLVGADPARNRMILNSGDKRGLRTGAKVFLRTWDWAGRWGMVVLKPGELPARVDAGRYLGAVADFEQVAGAVAATPAYQAALRRWPQEPRVHLALGNQAYAANDRIKAIRHYRDGLTFAPGDPVLGNNLASAMVELGCKTEAKAVLARAQDALSADSTWRGALERTARELETSTIPRGSACQLLR